MEFTEALKEIDENTSSEMKKKIHFYSFRNFVYHYTTVKKEKIKITSLLNDYITYVKGKNFELTENESKKVYYDYINQLGNNYFRRYLGFSLKMPLFLSIFILIVPCLIFWFIFHSFFYVAFICLVSLYLIIMNKIKEKKLMVYGYNY
jgi:uncharacterized membrane protein YbhN (UPF0104 family)